MAISSLKSKLDAGEFIIAPGVFDMMSLLIAEQKQFSALFFSGYWGMASHLGLPDAGIATYTDFVTQIQKMAAVSKTPIIADADTGFGGLLNLDHTTKGYEAAGASAIQIEDQVSPKLCGHQPGKRVVPTEEMIGRIKVAVSARKSSDFLVIARTDAIAIEGIDAAITRGRAYHEVGADIVFVEAPQSESEMARICNEVPGPQMINMAHGGFTPILNADVLAEMGYAIAIVPAAAPLSMLESVNKAYDSLKSGLIDIGTKHDIYDFNTFCDLLGFPDVHAFQMKWADVERKA